MGPEVSVVVVDHYDSYTWNLVHLIARVTGSLPRVVEHDQRPDLSGHTHVVLSPGPGDPHDPADFGLGAGVFEMGVPVLGVCLGMQALVTSYGGEVTRVAPVHGEVATVDHDGSGIFAGIPTPLEAVRYHSLAATRVPDVLRVNAIADGVVMGVLHVDKPLWGVQFHPESILSEHGLEMIRNFLELS